MGGRIIFSTSTAFVKMSQENAVENYGTGRQGTSPFLNGGNTVMRLASDFLKKPRSDQAHTLYMIDPLVMVFNYCQNNGKAPSRWFQVETLNSHQHIGYVDGKLGIAKPQTPVAQRLSACANIVFDEETMKRVDINMSANRYGFHDFQIWAFIFDALKRVLDNKVGLTLGAAGYSYTFALLGSKTNTVTFLLPSEEKAAEGGLAGAKGVGARSSSKQTAESGLAGAKVGGASSRSSNPLKKAPESGLAPESGPSKNPRRDPPRAGLRSSTRALREEDDKESSDGEGGTTTMRSAESQLGGAMGGSAAAGKSPSDVGGGAQGDGSPRSASHDSNNDDCVFVGEWKEEETFLVLTAKEAKKLEDENALPTEYMLIDDEK